MAKSRTIAVVTGTRAEYGLLEPVMQAIDAQRGLRLKVIASGMHLTTGTWRQIGFDLAARVPMQKRGQIGRAADVQAVSRGVAGFGKAFTKIKPDFVIVLGDRIEAFAAASAASIGGYRLVHIHGGDRAEGVADEAMRHAISKLAHVHCAATAQSRRRLIRMGESHVYNTGSPAVDGLRSVVAADDAPDVIVMQHPIGDTDREESKRMRHILRATKAHKRRVVMWPNRDPGSAGIVRALPADAIEHMPRGRWLSMLAGAQVIVGNSSAGLIEAAVLRTPCVNIGPRQAGRQKPRHVIDCDYGERAVRQALRRAMRLDLRRMRHPYGDGRAGQRIAGLLASEALDKVPVRKHNAY